MDIWAYCLMPNYVQLVVVPSDEKGLTKALSITHQLYARRINKRNEWSGHLWQVWYASYPMDEQYLMTAVRYVALNPCEAGLVPSPYDWKWSSGRAHLKEQDDGLVTVLPMLRRMHDRAAYLDQRIDVEKIQTILESISSGKPAGTLREAGNTLFDCPSGTVK